MAIQISPKHLPTIVASCVLFVVAGMWLADGSMELPLPGILKEDKPPVITFTWSPAGRVSLKQFKGHIRVKDDRMIDFRTYRLTLVELNKTVPFPLADQVIGREYDDDKVYFALIANDPKLIGKDRLTVRIEVADTAGHKSTLEKVILIKP